MAKPSGKVVLVAPQPYQHLPQPFKAEPAGGGGVRLHHKFVVIDFEQADRAGLHGFVRLSQALRIRRMVRTFC